MTLATYDVGDTVRLLANFSDTGGSPHDPTSVSIMYRAPSSIETTVTTTSTDITHPSTGAYFLDIVIDSAGTWRWRASSTGSLVSAGESVFVVRKQWVGAST
jgi:hypothetical protein